VTGGWGLYLAKAKKSGEFASNEVAVAHTAATADGHGVPASHGTKTTGAEKTHVSLGRFTVELKISPNQPRIPGLLNLADLEIEVDCDSVSTCAFIEKRMVHVRNEVTITFSPMDKEDLLSKDGKQRFLNDIVQRLNRWLPEGSIKQAYISWLVIN